MALQLPGCGENFKIHFRRALAHTVNKHLTYTNENGWWWWGVTVNNISDFKTLSSLRHVVAGGSYVQAVVRECKFSWRSVHVSYCCCSGDGYGVAFV